MIHFEEGEWYRNTHGRYQVVEVDDDVMHVRLDDGRECLLDAQKQAVVSRAAVPPWWDDPPGRRQRAADDLRARGVQHVYHFTAQENLQGIRDVGAICSKTTLDTMGRWPVRQPGGDADSQSLDKRNGNWPYVSLSFAWHTPQFFNRLSDRPLVSFCISPEVVGARGSKIYDTNANGGDRKCLRRAEALSSLAFGSFRQRPRHLPKHSPAWRNIQAEVLILDRVPLCFVERIVVDWRIPRAAVEAVFGDRFPSAVVNFKQWWHGTLPCSDALQLHLPEPEPAPPTNGAITPPGVASPPPASIVSLVDGAPRSA